MPFFFYHLDAYQLESVKVKDGEKYVVTYNIVCFTN